MSEERCIHDLPLDQCSYCRPATARTAQTAHRPPQELSLYPEWVAVHAEYKGHTIQGQFNPATLELKVITEPWSGKIFPAPTSAAVAVVDHFSPEIKSPNTNGRTFWKVTATGLDLHSLVGER